MDSVAKASVSPIRRPQDFSRDIPGADYFVKVPDGQYVVEFIGSVGFYYRGSKAKAKVALWFIITEGPFKGERIAAFCNVRTVDGKRNERVADPHFTVGWKSNLAAYLATLFDWYGPNELPTMIPLVEIMERGIAIKTRTVTATHDGQKRPEPFQNSVVDAILGWAG